MKTIIIIIQLLSLTFFCFGCGDDDEAKHGDKKVKEENEAAKADVKKRREREKKRKELIKARNRGQ